jgi:hypothetical protein
MANGKETHGGGKGGRRFTVERANKSRLQLRAPAFIEAAPPGPKILRSSSRRAAVLRCILAVVVEWRRGVRKRSPTNVTKRHRRGKAVADADQEHVRSFDGIGGAAARTRSGRLQQGALGRRGSGRGSVAHVSFVCVSPALYKEEKGRSSFFKKRKKRRPCSGSTTASKPAPTTISPEEDLRQASFKTSSGIFIQISISLSRRNASMAQW